MARLSRFALAAVVVASVATGCEGKRAVDGPIKTEAVQPFSAFAGFSNDGTRFAWIQRGDSNLLRRAIAVGENAASMTVVSDVGAATAALKKEGFSTVRRPPPADVTLEGNFLAQPPKVRLVRAGKKVDVPMGEGHYDDLHGIEIWGQSEDGKHVVLHVARRAAKNVEAKDFHLAFVAAIP